MLKVLEKVLFIFMLGNTIAINFLNSNRYLLVLDDVWNDDEDKWVSFRSALSGISEARGSKVMVTTRSDKVATIMQSSSYSLGKLSDEDSLIMFKQRAFAYGGATETDALTKIGIEIVKRCCGLPLAIKVIAGLMFSKKSEDDWLSVKNNQLWNIEDDTKRVVQTLKISYNHLPFLLKRCFCFCSIYRKDKVIRKDELIQSWVALGLLQPPSGYNQGMEDLRERYFKTLLSMCLLQDTEKDNFGDIVSCKMHDIVHDLAVITTETDYPTLKLVALDSSINGNPQSHLRVFSSNNLCIKGDPIGKLKHLRYLDISETNLDNLPTSITTCYNLYTIKFKYLRSVSAHIGKLINLRHLCVRSIHKSGKCWLTGIGRLTCLETLPFFGVNREHGCHITELESLNNLKGSLIIFGLDDVVNYKEAKVAFLSQKRNLRRLTLCWGMPYGLSTEYSYTYQDGDNPESVLEGLEPHSNLKALTIENFKGTNFPQWMMVESKVLGNLVSLKLDNCDKCEEIPPLGHLQHLIFVRIISLSNVREIGVEFYGSNVGSTEVCLFPALRELSLKKMPKLERWLEAVPPESSVLNNFVFPCLENLMVIGCPNLKSIPSHFPSLTKLSISDIDSLALKELSRMQTSLTRLELESCRGSEFQSVLDDFLTRNNRSLTNLRIKNCEDFVCLPDNLVALEDLNIYDCKNLTHIQHCLPSARRVLISGCSNLIGLPSLSQVFPVMEYLKLENCNEIVALPDICSHTCLQTLQISGLEKITSVPELCKSLRYFHIYKCGGLTSLPEELGKTLLYLGLLRCNALVSLPDCRYLRSLYLYYAFWKKEERGPSHLSLPFSSEFQCLETLLIGGLPELKSLPDQIQHLNALTILRLEDLDGIESLPDWLGNLISLQTLCIGYCEKLKYFPSVEAMRRLVNLRSLLIWDCWLLEQRMRKGRRPEWRKISHIPRIEFNGRGIYATSLLLPSQ